MGPTSQEVAQALVNLGNYRVKRAQIVANQGAPDGISGALLLALGMRETWLRNVEGGARQEGDKWVAEDRPDFMDVGWTQISRRYHLDALKKMPGVKSGTWGPLVVGATAADAGYVPRFEEALQYTLLELHEGMADVVEYGVPPTQRVQFVVAAHNAGTTGALKGHRAGDIDRYTAGGNYSAWVLAARAEINRWLVQHPRWEVKA